MSLPYNGKLIPFAKEMRKNATPQENKLWYRFLSKYPLRFQRQKIIGSYIADFYCHKAKLIIELDGNQHYSNDGIDYDSLRTDYLESADIKILRFANKEIDVNFQTVCEKIDSTVKGRV